MRLISEIEQTLISGAGEGSDRGDGTASNGYGGNGWEGCMGDVLSGQSNAGAMAPQVQTVEITATADERAYSKGEIDGYQLSMRQQTDAQKAATSSCVSGMIGGAIAGSPAGLVGIAAGVMGGGIANGCLKK
ncbi:MAG: hypothetical protein KGM99_19860 [Burkholderiales bacterium]|nr:hypothetical protein [Burkholderiales bacterium]